MAQTTASFKSAMAWYTCRQAMEKKNPRMSEDWLAVWVGLLIFGLSLSIFGGADLLGWGVTTQVWLNVSKALAPVSKAYATLSGTLALLATFTFLLVVSSAGAKLLGLDVKRYATGFTVVFGIGYLCWIMGSLAYLAATPDKLKSFGIAWSLNLTNESGFIVALAAGLIVGNF